MLNNIAEGTVNVTHVNNHGEITATLKRYNRIYSSKNKQETCSL